MSMDNRNTSALFKRAEQLKRWEESETNKHSGTPKSPSMRRIKFSSGCIFLAACVAGDKDEVSRLLETGADIDTANVDGLTALHQACIDDNLDMVEFLVQNGADVNRKDNEGWTPLHATSSCGFLSIARYLIESGAELASINSDGELALDLACSDAMEDLIQRHIDEQGIDCEEARQAEEKIMLNDAKRWLRSDSTDCDKPHPKTGATAIHVAAAKGYGKVLALLLDGRGDFDKQDVDGWTPLHAAAYWGQKEAVQMLLNANVDIDIQNYSGQYAIDIAQKDIVPLLDEARKNNLKRPKRRPASQIRITDTIENSIETPTKVIRVEVKPIDSKEKEAPASESEEEEEEEQQEDEEPEEEQVEEEEAEEEIEQDVEQSGSDRDGDNENGGNEVEPESEPEEQEEEEAAAEEEEEEEESEPEASVESESSPYSSSSSSSSSSEAESSMTESDTEDIPKPVPIISRPTPVPVAEQIIVPKPRDASQQQAAPPVPWRRPRAIPTPIPTAEHAKLQQEYLQKLQNGNGTSSYNNQVPEKENQPTEPDVILRRTQSFESDEKFYQKYVELRARIQANSCPILPNTNPAVTNAAAKTAAANNYLVQRSASLKDHRTLRKATSNLVLGSTGSTTTTTTGTTNVQTQSATSPPTSPTGTPVTAPSSGQIRRSFVPPTRDEESETQRKAHAKRVRETRRSTQGVTLDEIKSAEQLVKKKNSTNAAEGDPAATTTTTTTPPTSSSSSSTSAAVPTPPPPVNDRVPAVDPSGTGSNIPEVSSSKQVPSPSSDTPQQSASFTLSAPPSTTNSKSAALRTGDGGGGGGSGEGGGGDGTTADDDGSKISVSYTIAAPKSTGSESSVAAKITATTAAKEKSKDDAVSTTATFSVPTPATNNNLNKKTESDEFAKPTTPASAATTIRAPASSFSTSKRSLFDIDNANSLTLAEKLRQEANKYAESDKENFVSSAKSSTKSSSESTAAAAPANVTPAAAAEGTVLLRKDSSAPSSPLHQHHHQPSTLAERRPSWRLKVDGGSKFKLEDASAPAVTPTSNSSTVSSSTNSSTALDSSNNARSQQQQQNELNSISASSLAQRRQNGDSSTLNSSRPASAPELATATTATSNDASLHLRRSLKSSEENKENDKENDNRSSAQATQAVIQRRRRPKRRSTGVVHVDMEDIDPERQDSPVDGEEKESGAERGRSRVGSTASDLAADAQKDGAVVESKENGGDYVDYKALYEQAKADNEKLKSSMRKKDEEVISLKSALDRFTTATTKNNSLSELEKRERRAMERKMSEMEEELKQLEALKTENQRLKDENGALIRVISKLSR